MILLVLLSLALSAAALVGDDDKKRIEVVDAPAARKEPTTKAQRDIPVIHLKKLLSHSAEAGAQDLFPPHSWHRPAPKTPEPAPQVAVAAPPIQKPVVVTPPPAPPPVQTVAAAPPPPPPPTAPPLPFVYLGKLESEEVSAVFLAKGDRNVIARQGDVIDAIYRVDTVSDAVLTFTHLPTGIQQNLPIGRPR
jgi:hypothetical protein